MAGNQLLSKLSKYILDSDYRFIVNAGKFGHFPWMDDKRYIERMFKAKLGYELNLNNPRTFNEKLQWLKLYDRNPLYSVMVDKYAVKEYVANIIGEKYIIPTLGIWESAEDIDFASLPNQFVLKCTHDSHGIVICKDKHSLNINEAKKKLSKALKTNYYYFFREWPYKDVKPRIIAEKYMEDTNAGELRDYKFFCFNGVAKCFKVDFDRFIDHHANYYDMNHNLLDMGECVCPPDHSRIIDLPENISDIGKLGEMLSDSIPFLRTDFYDIEGNIYFGELTFFPASGVGKFLNSETDLKLGTWMKLPDKKMRGRVSENPIRIQFNHRM